MEAEQFSVIANVCFPIFLATNESVRTALQKLSQNIYPNGVESQSPGLAALFAAYPGGSMDSEATLLKGLRNHGIRTQPFQGRFGFCSFPRVGCKKTQPTLGFETLPLRGNFETASPEPSG